MILKHKTYIIRFYAINNDNPSLYFNFLFNFIQKSNYEIIIDLVVMP